MAKKAWSPISYAGCVYEFNRGVYVIGKNNFERENLDYTNLHHGDATILATRRLMTNIHDIRYDRKEVDSFKNDPYTAGVKSAQLGNIVAQFEGDKGLIFLTGNISASQIVKLIEIISPRSSFKFEIWWDKPIEGELSQYEMIKILYKIKSKLEQNYYENFRRRKMVLENIWRKYP